MNYAFLKEKLLFWDHAHIAHESLQHWTMPWCWANTIDLDQWNSQHSQHDDIDGDMNKATT